VVPFAVLVTVTVTPGNAPPVSSVIVPPMLPPTTCARAVAAANSSASAMTNRDIQPPQSTREDCRLYTVFRAAKRDKLRAGCLQECNETDPHRGTGLRKSPAAWSARNQPGRSSGRITAATGRMKYSAADQINRQNVASLQTAWTWRTGEQARADLNVGPGAFEVTPIMIDACSTSARRSTASSRSTRTPAAVRSRSGWPGIEPGCT